MEDVQKATAGYDPSSIILSRTFKQTPIPLKWPRHSPPPTPAATPAKTPRTVRQPSSPEAGGGGRSEPETLTCLQPHTVIPRSLENPLNPLNLLNPVKPLTPLNPKPSQPKPEIRKTCVCQAAPQQKSSETIPTRRAEGLRGLGFRAWGLGFRV